MVFVRGLLSGASYLARGVLYLMKPTPATGQKPHATRGLAAREIVFQAQTARTIGTIARQSAPRNMGLIWPVDWLSTLITITMRVINL